MELKFHSKQILGLLTILPLLASISIVNNFDEAFAKSELDFNKCTGFLSADEVKTSVGYSGEFDVIKSDFTRAAKETIPNLLTKCSITFKPTTSIEPVLAFMVAEFNSTEAANERFKKSLHYFDEGGVGGIKGDFDNWETAEVTIQEEFEKNLLGAQYQTYVISIIAQLTGEDIVVGDDLRDLSTIVLEKLGMDADTITKDWAELKIQVEENKLKLDEKEAIYKTQSVSDQISEGNPLTEAPIDEEKTMSPYYQLKMGTASKDINCNEGLELILNPLNGSPNCVKPDTASVLIKRGWTTT